VLPSIADQGGLGSALLRTLTLQINPYFTSILSMYVILMICSFASLWLLERGQLYVLAGIAIAIVIFGAAFPTWTALPREAGVAGPITLATWFGLITVGVIVGWYWRAATVRELMVSRTFAVVTTVIAIAGVVGARAINAVAPSSLEPFLDTMFSKDAMGPGRILVSVCSYFVVYRALTCLLAKPLWIILLAPLNLVGKRSLDSYLILSSIILILPGIRQWERSSPLAMLIAAAALAMCIGWAAVRPAKFARRPYAANAKVE
jgi:hypothetical protein